MRNSSSIRLPVRIHKGSPNVVKEALACNLPVVSTRVGDVPEMLGGLKNCHVGSDEPSELSSRVLQVLTSGERTDSRERMGVYSLERTAAAILRIYRDVCSTAEVPGDLTSSMEGTLH